jgi:hypothetical protein
MPKLVLLVVVVLKLGKNTDLISFSHVVVFADRSCTRESVQNAMLIGIAKHSSHDLLDMTFQGMVNDNLDLLSKVHPTTKCVIHATSRIND